MCRWTTIDLLGQKLNRLLVIEYAGKDKHNHRTWKCLCDCGNSLVATTSNLRGTTKSCGCLNRETTTTHRESTTRMYQCWADMKTRCDCRENSFYAEYGGRGISYDPLWKTYEKFKEDMSEGYQDCLTLDREDTDGNYTKNNCRWSSVSVQNHNRRKQKNCSSKYIGVCLDRRYNCWYARIKESNDISRHLGTFKTELSAALCYDDASEFIYGDRPNKTTRKE